MTGPLVPPYSHHLDLAMQTVATVVLWGGTAALLLYAISIARQERSWIPILIVVATATGSIIEPLYDTSYHLLWYTHGQWTLFTAFGLPQPVWVMPAYVMVFGLPALLLYRRLAAGAPLSLIFKFAGLFAFTTAVFEIAAVNLNLYGYYGSAPMRLFHYPLWIAFMETSQITGYAVLAAVLKRWATKPQHALALLLLFPANFAFETLGGGFPTLMAINTPHPSDVVMWLCGLLSIGLAMGGLWLTSQLLLVGQAQPVQAPARDPRGEAVPVAGTGTRLAAV